MAHKRIRHELRDKITEAVQQIFSEYSTAAGRKLKKSSKNCAKELSNKFIKSLKEVEKAERKSNKKLQKKENKATEKWLKSQESEEVRSTPTAIEATYSENYVLNANDPAFGSANSKKNKEFHIET